MAPVRVVILCVALLAAVGAALVARTIAKGQDKPAPQVVVQGPAAPPPAPMAQVLVAKNSLDAGHRIVQGDLGANPIETLIRQLGVWGLRLLLVGLCISPLAKILRNPRLIRFRRPVGS